VIATAYQAERSQFLLAFGGKLRAEREHRNLSQEALAHCASLHRNEIGVLERGQCEPGILTLLILADTLRLPPCALLYGLPVPRERRPRRS
jgi:transcriptional regulator with XRE-family HTH domain